jgi:hypothetical protein
MPVNDNLNESPPVPPVPLVDENNPGLGRHTGRIASNRAASGGLTDDSADDPARDSNPIGRITSGG